jgi:glycosyltransferase involved in cell wall biosynthesis
MTYRNSTIAVLIAAYNESSQIGPVLKGIPAYVDHVVVVDDASTDNTSEVVEAVAQDDLRIRLMVMERNVGVGGALSHAYTWARDNDIDVAVSIDGDGQMDPDEMKGLIDPIVEGLADYTKGNRLADPHGWRLIPRIRLFGNAVLSLLTKMASGYWSVVDSQSGYSAAGRRALHRIDWESMYARYGRPNDVLILANVADCRVADVSVTPLYGVGERSTMKITKVTFLIAGLLIRRFWWRLFQKYLLRDFHPLLFFYLLGTITAVIASALTVRLFYRWILDGLVPEMTALAAAFFTITTLNSLFFAFWMDMQANAHLAVRLPADQFDRQDPKRSNPEPHA